MFTESGHFARIAETWKHRAIEISQDKVFDMLLDEKKIDQDTVAGMREWKHSGFSVDNRYGNNTNLTILLFTLDESVYSRELGGSCRTTYYQS